MLVFYFSAISRDIDLKFIQDTNRVVINSLNKIDVDRSKGKVTGTVHCFLKVQSLIIVYVYYKCLSYRDNLISSLNLCHMHIHILSAHIHVLSAHIHILSAHIHVLSAHIHVLSAHIHVLSAHIHVLSAHIHV